MKIVNGKDIVGRKPTILIYGKAGNGKTTALGLLADKVFKKTGKKTLVLDVDRTTRVLKGNEHIDVAQIDNIDTWDSWSNTIVELDKMKKENKLNYGAICVDNVSELERCILSDLGSKGKNKGVPAQGDYQYMQFKLVNSLRFMKSLDVVLVWTAWETIEQFTQPDGTSYSRKFPKINAKIVDNICGLCDIVAPLIVKEDGTRGFVLESMMNIYAKNQFDDRKGCLVEDLIK